MIYVTFPKIFHFSFDTFMILLFFFLKREIPYGKVFYYETFDSPDVTSRWIQSEDKKYDGDWGIGDTYPPQAREHEKALIQKTRNTHLAISTKFKKPLVSKNRSLIIQYEFRAQHSFTCSGAYMKLFTGSNFDPLKMNDQTPWVILFGPDRCSSKQIIQLIFNLYNPKLQKMQERVLVDPPRFPIDYFNHIYTLIIRPTNTYSILIDNTVVKEGSLLNDFNPPIAPQEFVYDPNDRKPADWVDNKFIFDYDYTPSTVDPMIPEFIEAPLGWKRNEPELIPDPDAVEPKGWNKKLFGEWKPPLVKNPKCKIGCGRFSLPLIPNPNYEPKKPYKLNPNYTGPWKPRKIPNPDYYKVPSPSQLPSISGLGFELWCTNKELAFTNILIAFDEDEIIKWNGQDFAPRKNGQVLTHLLNSQTPKDSEIEKSKINFNLIITMVVIYLIIIVLVAFFFIRRKKNRKSQKKD